jgi:hypothetical protein
VRSRGEKTIKNPAQSVPGADRAGNTREHESLFLLDALVAVTFSLNQSSGLEDSTLAGLRPPGGKGVAKQIRVPTEE